MKKFVFVLLGLLLPILVGIWLDRSFDSINNSIFGPFSMLLVGAPLIVIFAIPIIVWAIIASIYDLKNKSILYAYTIGMIIGIALAFSVIPNWSVIKTYL